MTLSELRDEVQRLFEGFLAEEEAAKREAIMTALYSNIRIYHILLEHCHDFEGEQDPDEDLENDWLLRDTD